MWYRFAGWSECEWWNHERWWRVHLLWFKNRYQSVLFGCVNVPPPPPPRPSSTINLPWRNRSCRCTVAAHEQRIILTPSFSFEIRDTISRNKTWTFHNWKLIFSNDDAASSNQMFSVDAIKQRQRSHLPIYLSICFFVERNLTRIRFAITAAFFSVRTWIRLFYDRKTDTQHRSS